MQRDCGVIAHIWIWPLGKHTSSCMVDSYPLNSHFHSLSLCLPKDCYHSCYSYHPPVRWGFVYLPSLLSPDSSETKHVHDGLHCIIFCLLLSSCILPPALNLLICVQTYTHNKLAHVYNWFIKMTRFSTPWSTPSSTHLVKLTLLALAKVDQVGFCEHCFNELIQTATETTV